MERESIDRERRLARAQAALDYWTNFQSGLFPYAYLHPPDLFAFDPMVEKPYAVPSTFIPVFVGGNINIRNRSNGSTRNEGSETTEFILGNFLPGGYKKRWNFLLFQTRWEKSEWRKGFANINYSFIIPKKMELASIYPKETFSPFEIPSNEIKLYFPDTVNVEEIPEYAKFFWDEECQYLTHEDGGDIAIVRDPLSTALWENILLTERVPEEEFLFPLTPLIESIGYYSDFKIIRCYYGNILQLFGKDQILTRIIRFVHDRDRCYALIGTEHVSQAVQFKINIEPFFNDLCKVIEKNLVVNNDLKWQILDLKLRKSVLFEGSSIDNIYDIDWIMNLFYSIDYWIKQDNPNNDLKTFLKLDFTDQTEIIQQLIPEGKEIRLRLAGFDINRREEILDWISKQKDNILEILEENEEPETFKKYLKDFFCETIQRSLKVWIQQSFSTIGEGLIFWQDGISEDDYLYIYAYDRYQGGSGISKELFKNLKSISNDLSYNFNQELKRILQCDVDISDSIIHNVFINYDSDYLWSVFRERSNASHTIVCTLFDQYEEKAGLKFKEVRREDISAFIHLEMRRLIHSKESAAFYSELIKGYYEILKKLNRTPKIVDLLLYCSAINFYDPRATELFEKYRTIKKGDLNEIQIRVSEMMPSCVNACPECIDIDDFYGTEMFSSILLDRRIILALLEVIL